MLTRSLPYIASGVLLAMLKKSGGFSEITGFQGYTNVSLIGGIILNVLLVLIFSEVYYIMDKSEQDEKHFDFESYTDAIYFTTVASSSCGFGDILPKTKKAKIVVTTQLMLQFFVLVPMLIESFKPGN